MLGLVRSRGCDLPKVLCTVDLSFAPILHPHVSQSQEGLGKNLLPFPEMQTAV